ncbi:hypothetical protein [Sedimentibacter sp.]|uniref:hypothetical protein n=1 Tax=Sedimentibacter sp. TaxID=1960295 RepID=UPI0028A789B2|nr:hypothetical protein [Sedimentibacter sp.]
MKKEYNKKIFTEAKQPMDQIRADSVQYMELNDFVELEGKKYKKTDDIEDIINKLK